VRPRLHNLNPRHTYVATARTQALLTALEQGFGARPPFLLVTGPAGTGKTTVAEEAFRRWGERAVILDLPDPPPPPDQLATVILDLLGGRLTPGIRSNVALERLLNALANATAGGRVAVLHVEHADALTDEHLTELEHIAEVAARRQTPLEVLLLGTSAFARRFNDTRRRHVSVQGELAPLSPDETREYLDRRPNSTGGPSTGIFTRKASRDIYSASLGVPGSVEALAAESLRRALSAGSANVAPEHVQAAASALRALRAEDSAPSLPPRQLRTALEESASEEPAPGFAAHEEPEPEPLTPSAEAMRPPLTPSGNFPGPDDPRVQAWVARFGGRGVQVGFRLPKNPMPLADEEPAVNGAAEAPKTEAPAEPVKAHAPLVAPAPLPPIAEPAPRVVQSRPDESAAPPAMPAAATASAAENLKSPAHPVMPSRRNGRESRKAAREQRRRERSEQRHATPHNHHESTARPATAASAKPEPVIAAAATPSRPPVSPAIRSRATDRNFKPPMMLVGSVLVIAVVALLYWGHNSLGSLAVHHEAAAPAASQQPVAAAQPQDEARSTQPAPTDTATRLPVAGPEPAPSTITPGQLLSPSALVNPPANATPERVQQAPSGKSVHVEATRKPAEEKHPVAESRDAEREGGSPQYAIVFGHYSTSEMAHAESDYLSRLVPLRVRVSPTPNGNTFHLVMGRFESSEAAEASLRRLQHQGLVEGAKVSKIPRWSAKPQRADATGSSHPISL